MPAQDDAVDAQLGVPVAPALADDAELAVQGNAVAQAAGSRLHLGELDHGAEPGLLAVMQGRQHAHGDLGAGVPVNDPVGGLGGVAAEVLVGAGDAGKAGVGLPQDVIGAAEDLGAVTEAAAPDVDEAGVDLHEIAVALLPAVEGAVAVTAR